MTSNSSDLKGETDLLKGDDIWLDLEFYSQLKSFLKTGNIPDDVPKANRNILTERAKHYKFENGEILYGDKIVIIEAEERRRLLSSIHVNPKTCVHSDAQQMFEELRKHFYWRSMLVEIEKFVKICQTCNVSPILRQTLTAKSASEAATVTMLPQMPPVITSATPISIGSLSNNVLSSPGVIGGSANTFIAILQPFQKGAIEAQVWNLVELKLMRIIGPDYGLSTYLFTISDPVSRWMDVIAISSENLILRMVEFTWDKFSILGFSKFNIVGFSSFERKKFLFQFSKKYKSLTKEDWPYDSTNEVDLCPWVLNVLNTFDIDNLRMDALRYRSKLLPELNGETPSSKLLKRPTHFPKKFVQVINTPNSSGAPTEVIDSRDWDVPIISNVRGNVTDLDEQAVKAVQDHLVETKDERSKRGPYIRLSSELKKVIADHALTNGYASTANLFSEKLGQTLSAGSVRHTTSRVKQTLDPDELQECTNDDASEDKEEEKKDKPSETTLDDEPPIKKPRRLNVFTPEMRAAIAKCAIANGVREACKLYKVSHNFDLGESTVRAMRNRFLNKKSELELLQEQLLTLQTNKPSGSPRGRPSQLGKHKKAVAECLRELIDRGEKITSYLVLTTAKTVINQREPSILVENGGTVELKADWARSFIKRRGLRKYAAEVASKSSKSLTDASDESSNNDDDSSND